MNCMRFSLCRFKKLQKLKFFRIAFATRTCFSSQITNVWLSDINLLDINIFKRKKLVKKHLFSVYFYRKIPTHYFINIQYTHLYKNN